MRENLEKQLAYIPPGPEYLNLATNENFSINHQTIMELTLKEVLKYGKFNQYGQSSHTELREKYAKYINVTPDEILPAPGSESLIAVLLNAFVTDTLLTFNTDFFRYGEMAYILGKKHLSVNIEKGIAGLIETTKTTKINLIMLSNPNNPLGIIHTEENLIQLLEQTDCYVVIDEAYAEYYGKSVTHLLPKYPKLIILKTMSKGWGLAGLRVGFMIANADIISYVDAVQGPFVLSDLNANIASLVLENEEAMHESVEKMKEIRADFIQFLDDYDVSVYPSEANFVYIKTSQAQKIAAELLKEKIAITARPDGLRITIGTQDQMEILKSNLSQFLPKK